jgi:TolB-like protein
MKYSINSFLVSISASFIFLLFVGIGAVQAQAVRVAILDFQNISGITKYDGLGKAMSSMLISDIESNVSPKRLQLVERSQIQKILKEQNFQASGSVNKSTAVQAGKILGVKYLLIGDVFILNDQLVINARLTNTETGDILFSKKQEGKMINWLALKTGIAKELATKLAMPFTEPRTIDATIAPAVLTTYANAIDEKDKGNFEKAETLISTAKEFDPSFGYLDDLRDDVDKLKKQVAEQGKKIDVLEKSGGRVVNAKTYEELKLNLTNQLTSYEEKKKIFVQIINSYPVDWEKDRSNLFYSLFFKKYNLDTLGLFTCNLLLKDILVSREFIKKDNLQSFDQTTYVFLGRSLMYAQKKISFSHDFSDNDFLEFKRIAELIIKNTFKSNSEQLYAHFFIFSNFNNDLKIFNEEVKKEVISNHKRIYELLNFTHGAQIIDQAQYSDTKEEELYNYYTKSKLNASEIIIVYLSAKRDDYRYVSKWYMPFNMISIDKDVFKYYFENNDENKSKNDYFFNQIKEVFNYFSIPSIDSQNPYLTVYQEKILNEIPLLIPLNETSKKAIIKLDSASRRYTRIMNSLKAQNFDNPCHIYEQSKWFIKQSDSIAITSNIYVFNNKFEIGSRIKLIYNSNKDTAYAYVIGQKISKTANEFEIVDNKILKNLNVNQPIKFIRNEVFQFEDLQANNIDISNQNEFENSQKACEAKKRQEQEQKARVEYFKKQAEEQKQKEEQKKLAYKNKIQTVLDLFKNKSIQLDTISFNHLINEEDEEIIGLDSIFSLAFHLIVDDIKNPLSTRNSNPKLDAQLSILLNLYFIDQIGKRNIYPVTVSNFKNAAKINLAHGYLLISLKFDIDAFDLAATEYKNVAANFKFDQEFNSVTREAMIALDWNDFVAKGLVTKKQIDDFNQKYKILESYK